MKKAVRTAGRVLKRILPKKWDLSGTLGLDDPADTGSVFAVIGAACPFLEDHMDLRAQFERPEVDLRLNSQGSIRVGAVLIAVLAFWFDKNVRKIRRQRKSWRSRKTRRITSSQQS